MASCSAQPLCMNQMRKRLLSVNMVLVVAMQQHPPLLALIAFAIRTTRLITEETHMSSTTLLALKYA